MNKQFVEQIKKALAEIEPMEVQEWAPAKSIARQLRWCLAAELGQEKEARPGPFTMGLIAVREFDMYGDRPELAAAVCDIERQAKKAFP